VAIATPIQSLRRSLDALARHGVRAMMV
jgi:hypothetical protein